MRVTSLILAAAIAAPLPAEAQESTPLLPFAPGEELVFQASVGAVGSLGSATMRIAGPHQFRGVETYLMQFHYKGKLALFTIEDQTSSWFNPITMSSLRYEKREKSPITNIHEEVDINTVTGLWSGLSGETSKLGSDAPLDELSFLYFIRTLPLTDTVTTPQNRHFDSERNPVSVRLVRREKVEVPLGIIDALLVEMRVRDPKRFGGEGVILIHLSADAARVPLRIESSVKLAGTMVLTLKSYTPGTQPVGRKLKP